ncbi:MAG: radical SAM protein [Bacilli bacterium]|jgi:DNA repair photolyase|nr:radical SAM protein [Bacilli bacterium]
MNYQPLENKSAMHHIKKPRLPYSWDLNIYRGCEHGCKYCFAIYSHDYLKNDNYFGTVYYKKYILEALEKELSSPKWKHEVVNIGGITDSYQPIERERKLMPEVLKLMIKYKTPVIISTKSALILRDIDLIKELSEIVTVNIAFTITTLDERVRTFLEPNASSSRERFRALKRFKEETNAVVGLHMMPIVPYLTDNRYNLEQMYRLAAKVGVDYILPGTLYLRGKTRTYFMNAVKAFHEDRYQKIKTLYQKGSALKDYKAGLYPFIASLEKKYHLSRDYMKAINQKEKRIKEASHFS